MAIRVPNMDEKAKEINKLRGSDEFEDRCKVLALDCLNDVDSNGLGRYTIDDIVHILMDKCRCSESYAVNVVLDIIGDGVIVD